MTSSNLNPNRPISTSSGSSSPSQGAEQTSSGSNGQIGQDFAQLQEQSQRLRNDQATTQVNIDGSNNSNQIAEVKAEDIEEAHQDTKVQETSHFSNANEAKTSAERLSFEATNLKAAARGRDPRVAQQLKLQAKEKELQALMEEYRARKEENSAYEAGRKANNLQMQASNMRKVEENNKIKANNQKVELKDTTIQANNVNSKLKAKETNGNNSKNPQESGQSPIGQNKGPTSANPGSGGGIGASPIGQNRPPVGMDGGVPTNNPNTGYGLGDGQWIDFTNNPFVAAAKALLRSVSLNTKAPRNVNPTNMIGMHNSNKTLYDLAISYLDAGQTQSALQGTPVNQDIIFTRTQATAGKGETETAIQYWVSMQQQNVQAEKDTFKQAERA